MQASLIALIPKSFSAKGERPRTHSSKKDHENKPDYLELGAFFNVVPAGSQRITRAVQIRPDLKLRSPSRGTPIVVFPPGVGRRSKMASPPIFEASCRKRSTAS